uniref:CHAT domain-containing protein n=3 Tax=Psilocybe cubensis TaxID=181762 RepID=A0A8H7XQ71_PSICU
MAHQTYLNRWEFLTCSSLVSQEMVEDESENIQRYAKHANVLMGPKATRRAVLSGLKQHPWVHLACHGRLGDKGQPFRASFELYDKPLTLLDVIRARLPNAEFAFLSACHSASGDANTRDENIHLSAAMQFCGFRSVVGTLWEMNDEDGPTISQEFYRYMFRSSERSPSFTDSAEALNHAVRAMRKAKVPIEHWVMFVHIGA